MAASDSDDTVATDVRWTEGALKRMMLGSGKEIIHFMSGGNRTRRR